MDYIQDYEMFLTILLIEKVETDTFLKPDKNIVKDLNTRFIDDVNKTYSKIINSPNYRDSSAVLSKNEKQVKFFIERMMMRDPTIELKIPSYYSDLVIKTVLKHIK